MCKANVKNMLDFNLNAAKLSPTTIESVSDKTKVKGSAYTLHQDHANHFGIRVESGFQGATAHPDTLSIDHTFHKRVENGCSQY